jgi:hypothetical protein
LSISSMIHSATQQESASLHPKLLGSDGDCLFFQREKLQNLRLVARGCACGQRRPSVDL